MPLLNEAMYVVMEGVATPEAVDEVFKLGMAHPMGPLTLADFIGLDVCLDIMRVLGWIGRSEVPALSAADQDGGCRLAGTEEGAGVLCLLGARDIGTGKYGLGAERLSMTGGGFPMWFGLRGCTELSAGLPQAAGVCLEDDADDGAGQRLEGQLPGCLELEDPNSGRCRAVVPRTLQTHAGGGSRPGDARRDPHYP